MTDTHDQVDHLLHGMRVEDLPFTTLLVPADIRRSHNRALRRTPSLWTAVAFATVTVVVLVLLLGLGVGKPVPSHSPTKQMLSPASRHGSQTRATVDPANWTADPDDPGWACREGTANAGPMGGHVQEINTLECMSTSRPIRGESPLAEGLSDSQIAQDLGWGPIPQSGSPVSTSGG